MPNACFLEYAFAARAETFWCARRRKDKAVVALSAAIAADANDDKCLTTAKQLHMSFSLGPPSIVSLAKRFECSERQLRRVVKATCATVLETQAQHLDQLLG